MVISSAECATEENIIQVEFRIEFRFGLKFWLFYFRGG